MNGTGNKRRARLRLRDLIPLITHTTVVIASGRPLVYLNTLLQLYQQNQANMDANLLKQIQCMCPRNCYGR